jgi:hypothetical protein
MNPLLLLAIAGGGLYLWSKSSSSSTPPGLAAAQSTATQNANYQAGVATANAQAFNQQAADLGLSNSDAQLAYDTGLTPQEAADAGIVTPGATQTASGWGYRLYGNRPHW